MKEVIINRIFLRLNCDCKIIERFKDGLVVEIGGKRYSVLNLVPFKMKGDDVKSGEMLGLVKFKSVKTDIPAELIDIMSEKEHRSLMSAAKRRVRMKMKFKNKNKK